MDISGKEKFELEKRNDNPMNYHSPGSISEDWRFNSGNITNSSLVVPTDSQIAVCRGDLVGASSSSSSSASLIDSFGPALLSQPSNSQNLGFCDVNVQNNGCTSNTMRIRNGCPALLGSGIDRTLDMGWNAPSPLLKGGIFLPKAPEMLPQSLSQFPADTASIERAAWFSCFSGGNFSDMMNPFGITESMGINSRVGGLLQGSGAIFNASGLKSVSGGQAQKNIMSEGEASKDGSLTVDHVIAEGSPLNNERKSENLVPSNDEAKQGVVGSGNDSEESEFSGAGVGGQDQSSMLEGNGGESSAKSLISKKRKRSVQDTEIDQAKVGQQSVGAIKDNPDVQQKGEQKPTPVTNKSSGKQDKQASQASEPPKEEYSHLRARRGQATNSHSLAERVRRERISERMKFLQDLVPGCSKVTGKAVMLDEIINYVQSLQRQVEFLSMKLATVNPRLDLNIEGLLAKDSGAVPPSALLYSSEMPMACPTLHPSQPGFIQAAFPGMENHSDLLWRTINSQLAPISGAFREFAQLSNVWDDELHNVVQMSYGTSAPQDSQDVNGSLPSGHLKVEL